MMSSSYNDSDYRKLKKELLQLHEMKKLHEDHAATMDEELRVRNAEHEVQIRALYERNEYLAEQLKRTQGLLYDSKLSCEGNYF